jgi:hypothetical protein
MSKSKIILEKTGKYFREISVIVIGVAITLFASYWIGINKEKRDINLHLNALKMELEENIKTIDTIISNMEPSVKYMAYLHSHDKQSLSIDTLNKYFKVCYTIGSYTFKTNAFEMFKTSGIMRLMDNKELLLEIWDAYTELSDYKQALDEYNKIKWSFIEKDLPQLEKNMEQNLQQFQLNYIPMYSFYLLGVPYSIDLQMKQSLNKLTELIQKFE